MTHQGVFRILVVVYFVESQVVIKRRQIITVVIWALAVCAISRADMMPLSLLDAADHRQSSHASTLTDFGSASLSDPSVNLASTADLDPVPIEFLPQPTAEAGEPGQTRPAQILTDRQNSVTLCLYALLSLWLSRSAPFVKRLHFSGIPDWYHAGGPSQIGHSFALPPDCLPSAPVLGFFPPDSTEVTDEALPQFRLGIVVSLWRRSQFTPAVVASRGPPLPTPEI